MPSLQITIATSVLLFVAGALVIITSERKESLVEGYIAWLMSLVVIALEYSVNPKAFAPVIAFFAGIPQALGDPPIAVAAFCWIILLINVVVALLDKNARLFGTAVQLDEIRLGPPDQPMKRSTMRRLADALMVRSRYKSGAVAKLEPKVEPFNNGGSAWLAMLKSERIRDALGISGEEVQMLKQVEFMGEVSSPHDLKLVLQALRLARAKMVHEAASDAQPANRSAPQGGLASPAVKQAG
jgi:hypothetical protein